MRRALLVALALGALLALPAVAQADFGIKPGSLKVTAEEEGGSVDRQASSHPYALRLSFELNVDKSGKSEGGELRDVLVKLPPGLAGYPFAVARCARQEFEGFAPSCSPNSQVGVIRANLPGPKILASGPIYNMVPPPGVAAELGFSAAGLNAFQDLSVRSQEESYGVLSTTTGIPLEATSIEAVIWGTPADPTHDGERGLFPAEGKPGETAYVGSRLPFLTLPATCSGPLATTVEVDSKIDPGHFLSGTAFSLDAPGGSAAPLVGCPAVPFSPQLHAAPTSSQASASAGLGFHLDQANKGLFSPPVPESGEVGPIVETEAETIALELPPGVTGNPSVAAGLGSCSTLQFQAASVSDPGCPEGSKLGTLRATTPLLDEPVEGTLYLAAPHQNPFGSLLALYLVASVPARGVLIKQAGRVDIDQATGQLTTTFKGLPPLPYSSLELNLREGSRAPLTTPLACGSYQAVARLYPFSDPGTATVRTMPFSISSGPEAGPCVSSEAQLANIPTFEAGTQTPLAGMYSPFVLKLSRGEADQRFQALNVSLPPGLTGRLAGTAECSDAAIAQAASRSGEGEGALEQAAPSCPADSQIGTVTVGAGSGAPLYVQGRAYLAGPYKGAPLSMAIITPAIAGPFDLGVVVVRAALFVNESTAQISVKSDPLPTILHGLPLDVRSIAVQVSKNEFTLNPTSCEAKAISAESISPTGQVAHLKNRFQVGGCRGLRFEPKLNIQLKGATKRAGHPALKAVVTYPKGTEYANIARAQVGLPQALFLDQGNLNKVCKQAELRSATCPKSTIYGHAKAWSPLLARPLEGPVYLGVGYGYKLPALVADLNGQVRFLLVGKVDTTKKHGLRNTFEVVPDAPVSRFVLQMKGGKKYGLLENSENLCAKTQRANARLTAQNGAVDQLHPKIAVECKKVKAKRSGAKARRR